VYPLQSGKRGMQMAKVLTLGLDRPDGRRQENPAKTLPGKLEPLLQQDTAKTVVEL